MQWSEDEHAFVVKEWAEGLSAAEIALRMTARFGVKRTRNAVIGRVFRFGLCKRKSYAPPKPRRRRGRGIVRIPNHVTRPTKGETLRAELALIKAMPPLDCAPVIEKAAAGQCRFIAGPPNTQICARAAVDGAWCAQHRRLVYQPSRPKPRTRTANGDELRRQLRREMWAQ